MKRKILMFIGALSCLAVLFVTSCSEPEPYPEEIKVSNFPEDRRIPAPVFTYELSGGNAILKWNRQSYIGSYILYAKAMSDNYVFFIKEINLNDTNLTYENDKVKYTISTSLGGPSGNAVFGLRAISVDGIKSDIYWAKQP